MRLLRRKKKLARCCTECEEFAPGCTLQSILPREAPLSKFVSLLLGDL